MKNLGMISALLITGLLSGCGDSEQVQDSKQVQESQQVQDSKQVYKVAPGSHFALLSANQWRYTHSEAPQKLWLAVFDMAGSTAGRSFVAGIRLKSSRAMTVGVSIGRQGSSEYEGASKRITLAPGVAQSVQVRKEFARAHAALKVQLDVLELEGGGTAELTIDSISLNET